MLRFERPHPLFLAPVLVFTTIIQAQNPLAAGEASAKGFALEQLGLTTGSAPGSTLARHTERSHVVSSRLRIRGLQAMMTGWHRVEASTEDHSVDRVTWLVNGRRYKSVAPLSAELCFGPTPHPRKLEALAYDRNGVLLYSASATVNAGGSAQVLDFVSPVTGERAVGRTPVEVCAYSPPDQPIDRVVITHTDETLSGPVRVLAEMADRGTCQLGHAYQATVELGAEPTVISAELYSRSRGGTAGAAARPTFERTVQLNMPPAIRDAIDVRLLEWPVQVFRRQRPVRGLGVADFSLLEDRQRREIDRVLTLEHVPLRLAIVFDWSGSTSTDVWAEVKAANEFVDQLFDPAKDSAMVGAIAHWPRTYLNWTGNEDAVRRALARIEKGYTLPGHTALYDTLVHVLYQFQGGAKRGLPAVVLLTDGIDTASIDFSREQTLAYARESGVPIYVIAVRAHTDSGLTKIDAGFLEALAAESGGTLYVIEIDARSNPLREQATLLRAEVESLRQEPGELANDLRFLRYLIAEREAEASRLDKRAARFEKQSGARLEEIRSAFGRIKSDLSFGYVLVAREQASYSDRWHSVQVQLAGERGRGWEIRAPKGLYW